MYNVLWNYIKQNKNVNTNTSTAVPIQLRTSYGMAYRLSLFYFYILNPLSQDGFEIRHILFITVSVLVHSYIRTSYCFFSGHIHRLQFM